MYTVNGKGSKAQGIKPEEHPVVDGAGLLRDVSLALMFPPDKYKSDICRDQGNDGEKGITECRRRGKAHYYIPDDASADSRQKRKDINAEDVHLLAYSRHGTRYRESDRTDYIRDQDKEFRIHRYNYIFLDAFINHDIRKGCLTW